MFPSNRGCTALRRLANVVGKYNLQRLTARTTGKRWRRELMKVDRGVGALKASGHCFTSRKCTYHDIPNRRCSFDAAKSTLHVTSGIRKGTTHSRKMAFQMSSEVQQAKRNLQVEPSSLNAGMSMYSRSCMSISSGKTCSTPRLFRASSAAKYLLPRGLMPSGCGGTDESRPKSSWAPSSVTA